MPQIYNALKGVNFTFSRWCRSGLVPKYLEQCECSRCRKRRGEPVTDESNALSEAQAKEADVKFRADTRRWVKKYHQDHHPGAAE